MVREGKELSILLDVASYRKDMEGIFAIISYFDRKPPEIYEFYKSIVDVEQLFDTMNRDPELDKTYHGVNGKASRGFSLIYF